MSANRELKDYYANIFTASIHETLGSMPTNHHLLVPIAFNVLQIIRT